MPTASADDAQSVYLTVNEVTQITRLHRTTVLRLLKTGDIDGFKIGKKWRIDRASLTRPTRANNQRGHAGRDNRRGAA